MEKSRSWNSESARGPYLFHGCLETFGYESEFLGIEFNFARQVAMVFEGNQGEVCFNQLNSIFAEN